MENHQNLLSTALIAFLLTVRPAFGAADADPYFALDRVLDVSIEIAPEDWDRLRGQTRTLADILVGADCLDSPADDIFTWFELYNASDGPIDLADFVMADDLTDESKRTSFPDGTVIEAGEFLQIELDKDGWPGFALGRDEELGIWTADGILVAQVDWEKEQADEGTSWARLPDITGEFQTVDTPTPGAPNGIPTAIAEQTAGVPEAFQLHGNWPNPFNASTIIAFDVERTVPVDLVVYDVLGRRVRTLHSGELLTAGHYRTAWSGRDDEGRQAASGVYLYRLTVDDDFTAVGRMALIR